MNYNTHDLCNRGHVYFLISILTIYYKNAIPIERMITMKTYKDLIKEVNKDHDFTIFINDLVRFECLPEKFISHYKNDIDWDDVCIFQELSENFIRKHKDLVNWRLVSINQKLSEDFILEFKDKVWWYYIVRYQKLSEDFFEKNGIKRPVGC